MAESWEGIRRAVDRSEREACAVEFEQSELEEGAICRAVSARTWLDTYLEFLGVLAVAVSTGFLAVVMNYVVFSCVLHLEF